MPRLGFIHDPLDIKLLILYVMSRVAAPVDFSTLTALSLQDDGMDYFLFAQAVEELVSSGHLLLGDDNLYSITEKGRANSAVMENSLPSVVRGRCNRALAAHNDAIRKEELVTAQVNTLDDGRCRLTLGLADDAGELFHLDMAVLSPEQSRQAAEKFRTAPEKVFHALVSLLLENDDTVQKEAP